MTLTYFALGGGLGKGVIGVVSPVQLLHSHLPVGKDFSPTQKV